MPDIKVWQFNGVCFTSKNNALTLKLLIFFFFFNQQHPFHLTYIPIFDILDCETQMSKNYLQIIDILTMWWERKGSEVIDNFFLIALSTMPQCKEIQKKVE